MKLSIIELKDFITHMKFQLRIALHAREAYEVAVCREELAIAREQYRDALKRPALRVVA